MTIDDNPYAAGQSQTNASPPLSPRLTVPRMFKLLGIGIGGGVTLGALANAVNGAVSPQYFLDVMRWNRSHVWLKTVGQGMLEGAAYGLAYSVAFIVLIAMISSRRCHFATALRYAFFTIAVALGMWLLGGVVAVTLAAYQPSFYNARYSGGPSSWPARGHYAWVLGSITGICRGGILAVFLTTTIYAIRHRHDHTLATEPGD